MRLQLAIALSTALCLSGCNSDAGNGSSVTVIVPPPGPVEPAPGFNFHVRERGENLMAEASSTWGGAKVVLTQTGHDANVRYRPKGDSKGTTGH